MASVRTTPPAGVATTPGRPRAGWGDDLAAALLGTWVVGGLFLDGWAHLNQPGLETFFSRWHAVFYLGFAVSTVVLARLVARHQRGRFDPALVPAGYGLGLIGVVLFVAGGVADGAWHTMFGVETGVAALLGHAHLLLLSGGLLMVTSPVRSAWTSPDLPARSPARTLAPALWATALTTAGALFDAPGSREGRRLLRAQELLLEARARLCEVAGAGPLPAPRLAETRRRLVGEARARLEAARARLTPKDARPPLQGEA